MKTKSLFGAPLIILLVVLIASTVLGCASAAEKAAEKAIERGIEKESGGKTKVDVDRGSVEVETEDGKTRIETGEGASLPDNFPKDIPVHKAAKVVTVLTQDEGESVAFAVSADFRDVNEFYRAELQKAGYKIEATMDLGETLQFVAKSADGKRQVSIQSTKEKDGTSLVIIYGAE